MSVEKVIEGGFCIGCGVCAAMQPDRYRMEMTPAGTLAARMLAGSEGEGALTTAVDRACPFSDQAATEDEIAAASFPDASGISPDIGRHLKSFIGHVAQDDYRITGSSGGFVTWVLAELLTSGKVDAVIHVKADASGQRLFSYGVSTSVHALKQGAKSRYYPVEMSEVLAFVRRTPGRFAITGVPCFLKALRLACREDVVLDERLRVFVGLVCGHLKSKSFGEFFAWQLGVKPRTVRGIDFRMKIPGRPASRYGIEVRGVDDGREVVRAAPMTALYGSDWGLGFFKYQACEFCDDVVAETADVAVGDAWLPEFESDWRGTNVVVVRDREILALVEAGIADGRLAMRPASAEEVAESQRSGLRHRREGLGVRLAMLDAAGSWRPRKRTQPSKPDQVDPQRRAIYALRLRFVRDSAEAYDAARRSGRIRDFRRKVRAIELAYQDALDTSTPPRRWLRLLKRRVKALLIDWRLRRVPPA